MKVAEFVRYGFNNTSFTAMNEASNIALTVSLFINFHKQSINYTVYSKTLIKAIMEINDIDFPLIYLCKTNDSAAGLNIDYTMEFPVTNICHCRRQRVKLLLV